METTPTLELDQERAYWVRWIGYITRELKYDNEDNIDYMQLLAKEYGQWGQQVLGEPRNYHYPYGELPKDYLRRAVRAASLAQLRELRAIRYVLQHPVPNGVPYSGNCQRVPVAGFVFRLVARKSVALPS